MKRKVLITISYALIVIAVMVFSCCRDIFHSKENIDYMDLVLDKELNGSVKVFSRNYYKFNAEQGVTYYISWKTGSYGYGTDIKVATFWYDTGGTITGEKESNWDTLTFTSSRTGDVIIRITIDSSHDSADYRLKVSTSEED